MTAVLRLSIVLISYAYLMCVQSETLFGETRERPYQAESLIQDLVSGDFDQVAKELALTSPLPRSLLRMNTQNQLEAYFHSSPKNTLRLNEKLINAASGATSENTWSFADSDISNFFKSLFESIASVPGISLNQDDLFHGHVFVLKDNLGILFHAKEYPSDLFPMRSSGFTTQHPIYRYRNFIWLLKPNRLWMLDASDGSPISNTLIYPSWIDPASPNTEAWQADAMKQIKKAKTVQESYFHDLGKCLGSVNFFTRTELKTLAPEINGDLLFFTCC